MPAVIPMIVGALAASAVPAGFTIGFLSANSNCLPHRRALAVIPQCRVAMTTEKIISICNVYRSPDGRFATVCVDSYGVAVDRTPGRHLVAKMVPVPHLGHSVIAVRGPLLMLAGLASKAHMCIGESVDDLVPHMPGLIELMFNAVADHWKQNNLPAELLAEGQEIFCVGWSNKQQRVAVYFWQKLPGADAFTEAELAEEAYGLAGPNDPSLELLTRDISTAKGMERLARGQMALFRQKKDRFDNGGKLYEVDTRPSFRIA